MQIAHSKVTLEFKLSGFLTKDYSTKEYHNWIQNNVIQLSFSNENKYITNINQSQDTNMTYENIRIVNSCVKVEELKEYIGRNQINEGLTKEYQVISA
jgi:hypothetical protein